MLVLAQRKVDDKSNEMPTVPQVLRLLGLASCTVTVEEMGGQTAIAKQIVKQGAYDVVAVKEIQERLYCDIMDAFRCGEADAGCGGRYANQRKVSGDRGQGEQRDDWL